MMIAWSLVAYEPGYVGNGVSVANVPHRQPLVVLRRATREEYDAYVREHHGKDPFAPDGAHFYELSTD